MEINGYHVIYCLLIDENLLIDVEDEFSNLVIEEVAQGVSF